MRTGHFKGDGVLILGHADCDTLTTDNLADWCKECDQSGSADTGTESS